MPQPNEQAPKKQALDLLGGSKKRVAANAEKKESPKPVAKARPVKKEALDLLAPRKRRVKEAPVVEEKVVSSPAPEPAKKAPTPHVEKKPAAEKKSASRKPAPAALPVSKDPIKAPISVLELSAKIGIKPFKLIPDLMPLGVFANLETILDSEHLAALSEKHGFVYEKVRREKGAGVKAQLEEIKEPEAVAVEEEPEDVLKLRTPIVTVMGHVDHGKTSLLDYIRRSNVVTGEAGGITQHIGAYTVTHDNNLLTFIDTPGHAIFTEMRARGADVTDIVVLVVAANDGIMPQTREAILHTKNAGKALIIAVNKCDLPAADPTRVRTQLMEEGLVVTDFGGDIECVDVSATTGDGIPDLLDLLCLQAEVLELRANPRANCRASIIEARVEQGRGSSATVIVESGTLKVGMPFICGPYAGKIKTLVNDQGKVIKKVLPGMPAEVSGFLGTPHVGDELVEMTNERAARKLSEERQEAQRTERLKAPTRSRMEDILAMMGDNVQKATLKIYLKGDVQGSVEAIKRAILEIESDKVECQFIGATVGPITESDVLLASSSDAVILGFNVNVETNAVRAVKREKIQVKIYSIVYELIDQVRDAMLGLLEPETRENIIGHAEIRQIFKLNKGKAAGAFVTDGRMQRTAEARVIRQGQVVFDGKMSTLRRFQDEVQEVKAGLECGIRLADYNDYEEKDVIECYTLEKIQQTL